MRFSISTAANLLARAVVFVLIGVAIVFVELLGSVGLAILGLLTCFICTNVSLREDAPTWGEDVFRAQMSVRSSPEQRAEIDERRAALISPLRFYNRCGLVLIVVGGLGFVWQLWR